MNQTANEDLRQQPISVVHHVQTDPISVQNAMVAAAEEKAMGFKQVMRNHWPAAMWSCLFSLALVMEGYDLGIVSTVSNREKLCACRALMA
jgi:SP family general alpha glucoside:H+ symporter-like MFS transporter